MSDDADEARELVRILRRERFDAGAATAESLQAWDDDESSRVEIVVIEAARIGDDELALVERIRDRSPMTEIVAISSDPLVEGAVEAVRDGVHSVLRAPVTARRLLDEVEAAWERRRHGEARMKALAEGGSPPRKPGGPRPGRPEPDGSEVNRG